MLYKVLTLVSLIIFSSSGIYGAAIDKTNKNATDAPSIVSDIKTDPEMCPTPLNITKSTYVSECQQIKFPSPNTTLVLNNSNVFLCLGLYDRFYWICHSRSTVDLPVPILDNKTAFDLLMANEMKNHTMNALQLCLDFENNSFPPLYDKTKIFVKKLLTELEEPQGCISICWDKEKRKINPLCLAIQVIEKEIEKEKKTMEKKLESKQKIDDTPPKTGATAASKPVVASSNPPTSPLGNNQEPQTDKLPKNTDRVNNKKNDSPEVSHTDSKANINKTPPESIENPSKLKESNEKDKVNPTQGQAPPLDPSKLSSKEDSSSKKEVGKSKNEESTGQIIPPSPNLSVEKSTISENTVNGDFDGAGEQNYDGLPETDAALADLDGNEEVISQQKEPSDIQDPIPESFDQSGNVPKPPRIITDDDSHFFGYFTFFLLFAIGLFVAYHHKHKIFAMLLEGRRSRGGRGRRRPSTANYRKLDCTLEEAVTSQCSSNVTHVIY